MFYNIETKRVMNYKEMTEELPDTKFPRDLCDDNIRDLGYLNVEYIKEYEELEDYCIAKHSEPVIVDGKVQITVTQELLEGRDYKLAVMKKKAGIISEALEYLSSTDWYLVRKLDIGTEIPEEVVTKRLEARTILNGGN